MFQTDGNLLAPMTAPIYGPVHHDTVNPISPSIQVSVGYPTGALGRVVAQRARDLVPPGEPASPAVLDSIDPAVAAGLLTEPEAELYRKHVHEPRADLFLAFLIEELEPAVRSRFRVTERSTGLWGFSYGGLFAAYAALSTDNFQLVGAGSPGPLLGSQVLELCDRAAIDPAAPTAQHLHLTVCQRELTDPYTYEHLGAGALELMARLGRRPVQDLAVTRELMPLESHLTGPAPSWFSFLRTCYGPDDAK